MTKKTYIISLFLWTAILFVALLMPQQHFTSKPSFIINIPHIDKVIHIFLFGTFAFLLVKVLAFKPLTNKHLTLLCISVSLALGFFTEFLQYLLRHLIERNFSLFDVFADLTGVCLALSVYFLKEKK